MSVFNGTVAPTCPNCGATTKLRTATKEPFVGRQFWGCSRFPDCRGIVNLDGTAANNRRSSNTTTRQATPIRRVSPVQLPPVEQSNATPVQVPKEEKKEEEQDKKVKLLNPELAESETEDPVRKRFAMLEID